MAELTPDAVVSKVKRGEKIDRADLSGIILANAVLLLGAVHLWTMPVFLGGLILATATGLYRLKASTTTPATRPSRS